MAEQSAVPMIVLTRHQDNVEAVNSTLRNAGHAVRCNWIRELNDLGDALQQISAHMLIAFVGPDPADTAKVMTVCKQFGAEVPVLIARDQVDEDIIAAAMQQGARDVVTLKHPGRLQAVAARELEAHRQARALNSTISSAREYRDQLKSFMAGSADAIAHVQEGIVVDANPAWLELYAVPDLDSLIGTPLMDAFDPDAHAAIKGALVACLQGKWSDHTLRANAILGDGSAVPLEMELSPTEFDAEPAVRLCIVAKKRDGGSLNEQLTDALERDASTGALQRRFFIERLQQSRAQPIKAGVRQLVSIEPDKLSAVCDDLGPLAVEEFIGQFGGLVSETRQSGDLFGRTGDGALMLLMERGTPRDVETWANNLIRRVASQVFRVGDKQISCTCSVGIGMIDPRSPDAATSINDAIAARRSAQESGGGRVQVIDHQDEDTRRQAADEIWVRRIKAALMENRFRLMQQPIASLLGEDRGMFDVLVRMIDEQGQELLPSEFMAAAERNDLMKNIDRWV
ncbi:MAG: GGDEF and EAL domain-containing protein, partial [Lysobacterales bacterium]